MWERARWDSAKARVSAAKHGISFEEAKSVFDDPLLRVAGDVEHSIDEERYVVVGMTARGRLVVVSFTVRAGGTIVRLIHPHGARRGVSAMRTKMAPGHRFTVEEVREILSRPMELVIDDAVAYWLEDTSGEVLGPEYPRSLRPMLHALRLIRAGRNPRELVLLSRLETGERYEITRGLSLLDAAEHAAGIPRHLRSAHERRSAVAPGQRRTINEAGEIPSYPMEVVLDDAVAYWLEDAAGERLGTESYRSLRAMLLALRLIRSGHDPEDLMLVAQLDTGDRNEVTRGLSLRTAAESLASIKRRQPRAP